MFLKNDNCARKDSLLSVKIDLRLIKVFFTNIFFTLFFVKGGWERGECITSYILISVFQGSVKLIIRNIAFVHLCKQRRLTIGPGAREGRVQTYISGSTLKSISERILQRYIRRNQNNIYIKYIVWLTAAWKKKKHFEIFKWKLKKKNIGRICD